MGEIPIFYVDLEGVAMSSNVFQFYPPLVSHQGHQQSPAMLDHQGLWLAPFPVWHHVLWHLVAYISVTLSGYHGLPMSFFQSNPKTVYGYSSVSLSHQLICPHGVHVTMLQH